MFDIAGGIILAVIGLNILLFAGMFVGQIVGNGLSTLDRLTAYEFTTKNWLFIYLVLVPACVTLFCYFSVNR